MQAGRGEERIGPGGDGLQCGPASYRTLDADRGRLPEGHLDAEVVGEGGLDDLLLDLAVEREGDLPPDRVLAERDQRVLFGQLGEGEVESAPVCSLCRNNDRLQGRRRELLGLRGRWRKRPDRIADQDFV